ncbi:hypothetical protein [Sulfuricurvum sp.]|uniref:hypothetical protein n=1 Tax=Sulfuricurvum sp. TaxID=2025608 RepID=UPI003C4D1D4F
MKKSMAIGMIAAMIMFTGCASKNNTLEDLKTELMNDKPIAVYSVPASGIYSPDKWIDRTVLREFPFIAPVSPFDFQGKFQSNFYDELKVSWKAVSLDKVDWNALSQNPAYYDIIYIQSVGIADSGVMADDFMTNIAKAYNIAPSKIGNLKQWIEKGGVLWSEAGIRASRFETFYPYGGINDAKTISLFSREHGTLFGLPLRYRVMKSNSVDMVNYTTQSVALKAHPSATQIKGVSKVTFEPTSFIESYPILQSNTLLMDERGVNYASYGVLGKGMIVTTVPTIYWHADDDGELYRWKLLSWILQRKGDENAKWIENPKLKP